MAKDEEPAESGPSTLVACSTCREQIQRGAKKCKTCDSYQDWRRFLNMSSSVLALLVALVSVLSFATPIAVNMLRKDGSNLTITLQAVQARNIYFLASNSGNRPGGIGDAQLRLHYGSTTLRIPLYRTGEPPFIMPGASRQIFYTLSDAQRQTIFTLLVQQVDLTDPPPSAPPRRDISGRARFTIEAIEFDGTRRSFASEMPYDQLNRALAYMDPRCQNAAERLQGGRLSQADSMFLQTNCVP